MKIYKAKLRTAGKPSQHKSTYWDTCPYCGAALDPGEPCDCRESCNLKSSQAGQGGNYV